MKALSWLLLALFGFGLALGVSRFQTSPGYMDADYYFMGGKRLAEGAGFSEMILWNYLDDPSGLPHPSHGYWMPLVSLVAALGMWLGGISFKAAQLPFILLAGLVPLLTAWLAQRLNAPRSAWLAGFAAAVSGFYLAFMPTSDAFGPLMALGAGFFLLLSAPRARFRALGLGLLAGLIHLTRADGLLWLAVALIAVVLPSEHNDLKHNAPVGQEDAPPAPGGHGLSIRRFSPGRLLYVACVIAGYVLIMGPWFVRNLAAFGAPMDQGGSRALWITDYDELFLYPAGDLSFTRWWMHGLGPAIQARAWAIGQNLQTTLAVQGMIFLLPFILVGLWQLRYRLPVKMGLLAWALIFLAMTLAFPFQGARGGFFHSGAAVQPLLWAAFPAGLDTCLDWGRRKRGWNLQQARPFFQISLAVLALVLSFFIAFNRVVGEDILHPAWNLPAERYQLAETTLQKNGAALQAIVLVNNPPGYTLVSGRPAIAIPYGDLEMVRLAAARYQAQYLIAELDQVKGENLFSYPGDRPGLRYLGPAGELQIYAIEP